MQRIQFSAFKLCFKTSKGSNRSKYIGATMLSPTETMETHVLAVGDRSTNSTNEIRVTHS